MLNKISLINKYESLDKEVKEHLLENLLNNGRENRSNQEDRIHLVISKEYNTKKNFKHSDFEKFVNELQNPHEFSVCLTYELVHKLVFDFDCLGCKNTKNTNEKCKSQFPRKIIVCVENTVKRILGLEQINNIIITRGNTHGVHLIFTDINVDRCMYRYLCKEIIAAINLEYLSSNSTICLDEGCTSFVLPFGRNHIKIFQYINEKEVKSLPLENIKATDLSPIPTKILPFYSLKYTTNDEDDDNVQSCELLTYLNDIQMEKLKDSNVRNLKSFFYSHTAHYIHDVKSFAIYKEDFFNAILPWALVRKQKMYCMWLFKEAQQEMLVDNYQFVEKKNLNILTQESNMQKCRFPYFDKNVDASKSNNGFVDDGNVLEIEKTFTVMSGCFIRFNNDGKETTSRKYILLEDLKNVRKVIYFDDVIPKAIWNMILIEYFDTEIEDNKFVMAVIGYITATDDFDSKYYTRDEKIVIMQQIIKNCLTYDLFTGVLNDIYGTYKKIITKISNTSLEDETAAMSVQDINDISNLNFYGNEVDNSKYNELKMKNYDIFSFCASLIYHHRDFMPSIAVQYYLYYYNYVNEDTLNKIISEFVDSNIMISLTFQMACARFTKEEKITLTTPAEMFKTTFKHLCYEIEQEDEETENTDTQRVNNLSFDDGHVTYGKRKSFSAINNPSSSKRLKKKIVSRDLIKNLKKYFWRPFTLNGIPYMYNGNEYEIASSTYKMLCDTLKCTHSVFQDIFNAKKFEQRHGRNFLYKTNFYYSSIKVPAVLNVVLKIRETTCGGINSLLQRSYLNTERPQRSDIDVYDVVVDGLNALNDIEIDLNKSSLRFILTQPVVPLKIEEDQNVKDFFAEKEYGFIALNVKDYNMCMNILEKNKNQDYIEKILNQIILIDENCTKSMKYFSNINSLIQILIICVINETNISEDCLDVQEIIHALFGKTGGAQIGWNIFENFDSKTKSISVTETDPSSSNNVINIITQSNYDDDVNKDIKKVVDLKTRIKWIFSRNMNNKTSSEESTNLDNPTIKNVVYSLSEQFSKTINQKNVNENKEEINYCKEEEFKYNSQRDNVTNIGLTDKTQKTQMRYKMNVLTLYSTIKKKFLQLVKYFNNDNGIDIICKYAEDNVKNGLPFRLKLASFLITIHFYKRLPKWSLDDVPCYRKFSTINACDNPIIPNNMLHMIKDVRFEVIKWLYYIAEKHIPYDFFTGFQNEYRDNILKKYIMSRPEKYPRSNDLLNKSDITKFESVLLTLTYLYYMSTFDVETLILLLKLILSIEFPGQWLKLCIVLCGHRHAGKSKLLDILTEFSKSSATFKEPSESNKENQPGFCLYISNMILTQDEISVFSNTFKKIISESKIDFRNNMGNVFASIYALSKLWYTCNKLPECPYDSAVVDRILHFMVDFWHEEITNEEVAQFRYFTSPERRRIYEFSSKMSGDQICSKQILKNEGSLPFVFFQKETKIFITSMINENAIKAGLYYISTFFSWFCFVNDIHKPVDIDIRNLPPLANKWRQQWLTQTNLYHKWKADVKINSEDGCDTKIPVDLLRSSFRKYAGNDYNTFNQLLNAFKEDFGRYFNKKDNTYSLSVDMNKLI